MSEEKTMSSPPTGAPTTQETSRLRGIALVSVLIALMLTLLLEALDQTIVGTALPRIVGELQGFDRYTWVVTAYLLASTTMIPIVSKLSDQFGRKWFLVIGVVVFLIGSALSGLAQTMNQLIAFRAIQGVGAGTGIALVFTVVGDIFTPAERARWQGVFSGVYGFSSVVGPTIGGWLTDHGPLVNGFVDNATRWRWVFYINLPVGIIALAALLIYMPTNVSIRSSQGQGLRALRRVDFGGALLAASATICLLLGLTWGSDQTYAWNSPQIIIILIAAAILYIAFIIVERFVAEPLMPLNLFRNRVFSSDSALALLMGMVLLPLVVYLPLYLQGILGESATNSGEVITPLTISLVIGAAFSGFLIARLGRYQVVTLVGIVLLGIGVFFMTRFTASTTILNASLAMVVAGVGLGMFFPVQTLAAQNAIPRNRIGVGTGVITYLRALGQTLGSAIVGTVVNNTVASDLPNHVPANAQQQLTPAGWTAATNTQVLIDSGYRGNIVSRATHAATQAAVKQATARIPAGPQQQAVAQQVTVQVTQSVTHLLDQVFDGLKISLMLAIQHGFVCILIFCILAFISALFLKDIPLKSRQNQQQAQKNPVPESGVGTENISAPTA